MYICEVCGEVFTEPNVIKERHPYGEGFATEDWCVCPCCESTNIVAAKKCVGCGEWFSELEDDLCKECLEDADGE
ncbi:MAG: hypothetical protein IJF12_02425 [Alphaproteobacteria bacterium]|nr:hypothetical protein [Alphaproteobacteria bacterium]